MRFRAPVLLVASLAACAISPSLAAAAESMLPYSVTVTDEQATTLADKGFDLSEAGYDASDTSATQELGIVATPSQVADLKRAGIAAEAIGLDAATTKSAALGDSPNPFFNVYRMYSEPGGIADEMRALAEANPDVMKL